MSALPVKITTGPHGNKTTLEIDGVPVKNAHSFVLRADTLSAVTLEVEYINVHVEVDALVEETAMGDVNRAYRRVHLAESPDPADV